MNYKMYSVKDVVVGSFSEVRLFNNEQSAVRWFDNACKETKIAGDLQLFYVGDFNAETGEIKANVEFIKGGVVIE